MKKNKWYIPVILVLFPLVCAVAALCIGRLRIGVGEVFSSVLFHLFGVGEVGERMTELALWNIRFPRIILAALCGAGLSASGLTYQSLFANPLATPDTLGVASGASFGAALGILIGFGTIGIQATSVIFGLVAVLLTVIAGGKNKRGMNTTVLAGIMIGSLFSALVSLVKLTADSETKLPAITYWLMGSLDSANYKGLLWGSPLILTGIIVLLLLRWRLNLLPLTDEEAQSAGVNIKALRAVSIVCSTVITASVISMCGQVGWVGLLVPHFARMLFGNDHRITLPSSICIGAGFMIIVDTVARSFSAAEFPVSILTAIIGAPFFIFMMRKKGGWEL